MNIKYTFKLLIKTFEKKSEFVELAVGVLSLFDAGFEDSINFEYLLTKIDFFGFDCLQIAFAGGINKFMSQLCVQNLLDNVWHGEVANKSGIKSRVNVNFNC